MPASGPPPRPPRPAPPPRGPCATAAPVARAAISSAAPIVLNRIMKRPPVIHWTVRVVAHARPNCEESMADRAPPGPWPTINPMAAQAAQPHVLVVEDEANL